MQKISFITLTFMAGMANAATAAHGSGVPTSTIFWQIFNLIFVFGIIYWATRKTIPELFRQRQETFLASAKKAEAAKAEAEAQYLDIKGKLEKLKATRDESLIRAQAEAADMKKQLLNEAQEQATRIRNDAESTVNIEIHRAQRDLHEKFVKESVGMARQVLSKDIGTSDHQKLQSEFTRNIEAVNP